jgi:hypothetical protein
LFVEKEANRKYYIDNKELGGLLGNLKNLLAIVQQTRELSPIDFNKINSKLSEIYSHPQYDSKKTDLNLLRNHFTYLSTLYMRYQSIRNNDKQSFKEFDVYQQLNYYVSVAPVLAPRKLNFFNDDYTIPNEDQSFSNVLGTITQPREKYYTYQLLSHLKQYINTNLKGFDIKYEKGKNNKDDNFEVSFKILDLNTYETLTFKITIKINYIKNKLELVDQMVENSNHLAASKY